jgi:hypothetical protein
MEGGEPTQLASHFNVNKYYRISWATVNYQGTLN